MAKKIEITPNRTYATAENAERAIENIVGETDVRYLLVWNQEGRCYPIFVGNDAIQHGIHFHFCTVN